MLCVRTYAAGRDDSCNIFIDSSSDRSIMMSSTRPQQTMTTWTVVPTALTAMLTHRHTASSVLDSGVNCGLGQRLWTANCGLGRQFSTQSSIIDSVVNYLIGHQPLTVNSRLGRQLSTVNSRLGRQFLTRSSILDSVLVTTSMSNQFKSDVISASSFGTLQRRSDGNVRSGSRTQNDLLIGLTGDRTARDDDATRPSVCLCEDKTLCIE